MKKAILILMVFGLLMIGCQEKFVCNKPYMRLGTECCLDQNGNNICDKDESIKSQEAVGGVKETSDNPPPVTTKQISNLLEGKCDEFPSVAIGYRGCTRSVSGDITIKIANLGSSSLVGFKYYIQNMDDQIVSLVDEKEIKTEIQSGDEASIIISEFTTKYPNVERIQIRPIAKVNGFDTVCTNHHAILTPTNCK